MRFIHRTYHSIIICRVKSFLVLCASVKCSDLCTEKIFTSLPQIIFYRFLLILTIRIYMTIIRAEMSDIMRKKAA